MNAPILIEADPDSQTKTPWPKAGFHPSLFIAAAKNQWPGLPRKSLLVPHLEKSDRKTIADLCARYDEAVILRDKNDVPTFAHLIAGADRASLAYAPAAVEAERLRREMATLSPEKYNAACADLLTIAAEAGEFGAGLACRLASRVWVEFDQEALASEQRLERFGSPLCDTRVVEGYSVTTWELHSEPVLAGFFCEVWFLGNYFPGEMRSPKLWQGSPLAWMRDLVTE